MASKTNGACRPTTRAPRSRSPGGGGAPGGRPSTVLRCGGALLRARASTVGRGPPNGRPLRRARGGRRVARGRRRLLLLRPSVFLAKSLDVLAAELLRLERVAHRLELLLLLRHARAHALLQARQRLLVRRALLVDRGGVRLVGLVERRVLGLELLLEPSRRATSDESASSSSRSRSCSLSAKRALRLRSPTSPRRARPGPP